MKKFYNRCCRYISVLVFLSAMQADGVAQQLAFPGAEGFGRYATGGRGGKVYEVTSLADSGPGTLREGLASFPTEPLTIVFKVGGTINLLSELQIKRSNLTIAGQTAPGDGICLKGNSFMLNGARAISQGGNHGNIIIRYLRSRPGGTLSTGIYGFDMENCHDVIIDHCSFSWANEECAAMYDTKNVTVQWSIISEGLYNAGHAKGLRSYGGVWGGQYASYHHNLIAHQQSRAIRFNGARAHDTIALVDYRNNVIYNSGNSGAAYGGEVEITGGISQVNIVNNYYKPGPANSSILFVAASYNASLAKGIGQWYVNGNILNGNAAKTTDNWTNVDLSAVPAESRTLSRSDAAFSLNGADISTQTADKAYESVLLNSGAFLPVRDAVDKRIVSETAIGTATAKGATSGSYGIIDSPAEVGGWPTYNSAEAPADTDHDGIADAWENDNGLNPNDAVDGNTKNAEGYTMLELYLNSLAMGSTSSSVLQGLGVMQKGGSETAADVKWATLNESGVSKFLVERSSDNLNFSQVGEVVALNQGSITEYLFTDNAALANTSYYRLKIISNNNDFNYSNAVSFYRPVSGAYWTEPFTTTTVTSILTPATVLQSQQTNGTWILYGAQKEERSISSSDPNNQWSSGTANPTLKILNNNATTVSQYGLTEAPYLITPVFSQGISKITFNELLRTSISAGSIVVYTSTDGGNTWSTAGINNQAKSSLFDLVTVNINSASVNRLKIAKPAGVTMNIDNLTIYGPVGVTLPLQFVSFTATLKNGEVNLNWSTVNEINTRSFLVERSTDGKTFAPLAEVLAKNADGKQNYFLSDNDPGGGVNYYRLRQTDRDGQSTYYDKTVSVNNFSDASFLLFPNPIQRELKVLVQSVSTDSNVSVVNLAGQVLKTTLLKAGNSSLALDMSGIAPGLYILQLEIAGQTLTKQFLRN